MLSAQYVLGEKHVYKMIFDFHFDNNTLDRLCANKKIAPTSAPTSIPTKTPLVKTFEPILTSTKAATATPENTATPEAPFKVCPEIENYKDCPITVDQLFDGTYLNWLNTLSKPFDPSDIRLDIPLIHYSNGEVAFQEQGGPNFTGSNAGKEPFRRNVTFGYTSYEGHNYIVMPVEFFDPQHPHINQWVISVFPLYNDTHDFSDAEIQAGVIGVWKNDMNTTPMLDGDIPYFSKNPDLLVASTLKKSTLTSRISLIVLLITVLGAKKQEIGLH